MISIPLPILKSLHLNDESLAAAIAKAETNAETLRAEINDAEQRIAVDHALASLGLKRAFSNAPGIMEIARHEQTGKGTFIAADMRERFARDDDLRLRLRLAEYALAGLHVLKAKRAELDKAGA